jgi:hypothetical protein
MAFDLPLADGSMLAVSEVVRVVPNKRVVCKALWNNQQVYAKLFIGANAKRYAQRDKCGVQALITAHIATPDLLYAGNTDFAQVLIFKAISAQNAEVLYQQLLESQQKQQRLQLMFIRLMVMVFSHFQRFLKNVKSSEILQRYYLN